MIHVPKSIRIRKLDFRGDTIVEVTLALAVMGLVLGSSVALANRNTRTLQDNQEHAVALRHGQSQLEHLKEYLAGTGTVTALRSFPGGRFCMNTSTGTPVAATNTVCRKSDAAGGANYNMEVTLQSLGNGGYTAHIKVVWEGLTAAAANIDLKYRVYEEL